MSKFLKGSLRFYECLQSSTTLYVDQIELTGQTYRINAYTGSIVVTELTNAFVRGADCNRYSIHLNAGNDWFDIYQWLEKELSSEFTLESLVEWLQSFEWHENQYGNLDSHTFACGNDSISVHLTRKQAIRVFSPYALTRLKPLKTLPAKFTLTHVKRILANGQFSHAKCDSKYSDDYAYDAAVNFHKGEISGIELLKDIVSEPSGWWCSSTLEKNASLGVSCHSFNHNTIVVDLSKSKDMASLLFPKGEAE